MARPSFREAYNQGADHTGADINAVLLSGTNKDGTEFTLGVTESDATVSTEIQVVRQNQEAILLELSRIGMLLTILVDKEVTISEADEFLLSNS